MVELFDRADGLVVATPVFKASYSGLLKTLLDLLPQRALAGKVVLPLATGGTLAHALVIDYALRPVLTTLGTTEVVNGHFLLDQFVSIADGRAVLVPEADRTLGEALDQFTDALASKRKASIEADPEAGHAAMTPATHRAKRTGVPLTGRVKARAPLTGRPSCQPRPGPVLDRTVDLGASADDAFAPHGGQFVVADSGRQ